MSGLRQGELVGLRWRDIDWAAGKDQGPAQALSRGVQQAEVPAWQPLRPTGRPGRAGAGAALQRSAYRTDDDLVFPHPETGNPYDTSKLRARYDAAVGAAGVRDDVRFHHLRHTFGTRMAAAGVPLRTLREWRGHRDYKTTLIYARLHAGRSPRGRARRARLRAGGDSFGDRTERS